MKNMKMRDMSDINDLYNAQYVILLCGKLSGCLQKEQSKVILALPTKNKIVETFAKTVRGGLSCVDTRLSFDTELLMPNYLKSDFDKMSIDESYESFKRDDLKVVYSIKINNEEKPEKGRII